MPYTLDSRHYCRYATDKTVFLELKKYRWILWNVGDRIGYQLEDMIKSWYVKVTLRVRIRVKISSKNTVTEVCCLLNAI